jgi:asparaginyl-tRNA synthetase
MMAQTKRTELAALYRSTPAEGTAVTVCGWAKTVRDSKKIGFISLTDGSCYKPVQVVFEADKLANYEQIAHAGLYTSFTVTGRIVLTPQARQPFEINADAITVLGACGQDYPLQKNRMSMDYLRTMTHLRPRTNTFNAAFRVRGQAAYALHSFFHENGFTYVHTPLFTGSDCEGAGEMFQVTTLDVADPPKTPDGKVDYAQDFFKRKVNLTVSGQLEAEAMAMALGKVYTFGPTFRAEKSYDPRHAAEFWMIEPEMAFADLGGYMDTAEAMTKYVIRYLMENCADELAFFNSFVDKGLLARLELVAGSEFGRISYTDAVKLLEKNNANFQYKVEWGTDIQTEHERYLTEQIFHKPVFVTDYPKEIKSFYMKQNPDGKTVAAADMLVPGIGELIGGSQREENYDVLVARMQELGMKLDDYQWYLDLRRYGSVPHAGYGLGFERLIMYVTGIANIRDVLPFPRTCGSF